jgi:hypothetical protein
MHRDKIIGADAHGQVAEEFPPGGAAGGIGIIFKLPPGPETGGFGAAVEIKRLVEHGEIMIPHDRSPAARAHQVETFHGVRAIADDITQADDMLNRPPLNLRQNGSEGFEIGMDVTDDGEHRRGVSIAGRGLNVKWASSRTF